MDISRSRTFNASQSKLSNRDTSQGFKKVSPYLINDMIAVPSENTPAKIKDIKKLFWIDNNQTKTLYGTARQNESKNSSSMLSKYKHAVYDNTFFFGNNQIPAAVKVKNEKLENSSHRSRVELPSVSLERMSILGNESLAKERSFMESSLPQANRSVVIGSRINDIISCLLPLSTIGGRSKIAERFRKNIIRLNRDCTNENGVYKESISLKSLGKRLYTIFNEILTYYANTEPNPSLQNPTDSSTLNTSSNHDAALSQLSNIKRQHRQDIQVKFESLEMLNNELFNELQQKQLLLEDVAMLDRKNKINDQTIEQLRSQIDAMNRDMIDFRKAKQLTDSKAMAHFNKITKAIDKLTDRNDRLQDTVAHRDKEIDVLRKRIVVLEKSDRAEIMLQEKFNERQTMMQEDINGRKDQVFELRGYIHHLKQSVGALVDNRKKSEAYYRSRNSTDNERVEKLNMYLERFYEVIKGNFFTYSISLHPDKDPVAGNYVHTFKDLINNHLGLPSQSLSSRSPLTFTAFDRFLIDKLKFDRKSMEFINCRKAIPNIFSLVRSELKYSKLENPDDLFGKRFNVLRVLEVLRGIMDSYYAELLSLEDWKNARSFSQFVYLWFEYFGIDTLTKQIIKTYQGPEDCSTRRLEFLIQLSSPIFLKLWDSFFFIEAICGNFNTDEITYYLYLRYYLLHGQQSEISGIAFEYRILASRDTMRDSLRLVDDSSSPMCDEIFNAIAGLTPLTVTQTSDVDMHLVLRVFLEVYVCKKACRVKSMFDSMMIYKQQFYSHDRHLTFAVFKKVVQLHYEGMTTSECLKFYSQVVSFAQGLNINLKAFYMGGQDVCSFTMPGMFRALFKIDYLKQVWANLACLDQRFENKYINTKTNKTLLEKQLINHNTDAKISLQSLQKLAHDDFIDKLTDKIDEKTIQVRQAKLREAESLGSMHLIDCYQKQIYLLNNPKKLTDGGFIGNFSHCLQKTKNLERNISAVAINIRMTKFASTGHEHMLIDGLLKDFDHSDDILTEINKTKCHLDRWKSSKIRMIQKFAKVKLNSFYKMVVELIKVNKTANNVPLW